MAAWTTYRGNAARSGVDTSSATALPFTSAWTAGVDGQLWGQPLVDDGMVIVADENDSVYAFNETTGAQVWHVSVGTPVPASELPCGDISPSVGITSTPVIDPANNEVFVVADTWNGTSMSSIAHEMYGLNLSNGSVVSGFPVDVDPPGANTADLLQRPGLALSGGKVFAGFGGNDGDCGTYNGWLVGESETGGTPIEYEVDADQVGGGGAIWGSGDGPVVDPAGDLWLETGNGFGTTYDYQESVLQLDTNLNLVQSWGPSNWAYLDDNDIDLGSGQPLLLPDGLVFAVGKAGEGYLLSESDLGGLDAAPLFGLQVCGDAPYTSFGGAVYYDGIIYVPCRDGLRALALNTTTQTFAPVAGWTVTADANGPPVVAGGLVWASGWTSAQLFGLNPQTGAVVVDQTTPAMNHFATPSASDGLLFFGAGQTVEAYTLGPNAPSPSPLDVTSSPASGQALVSWIDPTTTGGATISGYTITPYIGNTAQTPVQVSGGTATSAVVSGLTDGTSYTFTVAAVESTGASPASSASAAVIPEDTIFDFSGAPTEVDSGDSSAVDLGVKFTASVAGSVTGIRFYKAVTNTGTHIGSLWS
ncbi:MAG: DUF4082 domain-containing protein, partial [Solirubrobacteraceae bacterium]